MILHKLKLLAAVAIILLGVAVAVLSVHIYMVTRVKPAVSSVAMARIDLMQPVTQSGADSITKWLYAQHAVQQVLVNRQTRIVVFSYYNKLANADSITYQLCANLGLVAHRFVPTAAQMASGCPVANTSVSFRLYQFFKQIF